MSIFDQDDPIITEDHIKQMGFARANAPYMALWVKTIIVGKTHKYGTFSVNLSRINDAWRMSITRPVITEYCVKSVTSYMKNNPTLKEVELQCAINEDEAKKWENMN